MQDRIDERIRMIDNLLERERVARNYPAQRSAESRTDPVPGILRRSRLRLGNVDSARGAELLKVVAPQPVAALLIGELSGESNNCFTHFIFCHKLLPDCGT